MDLYRFFESPKAKVPFKNIRFCNTGECILEANLSQKLPNKNKLWSVLGSSWGPPGLFWGGLGALVACLRLSWRRQGPS